MQSAEDRERETEADRNYLIKQEKKRSKQTAIAITLFISAITTIIIIAHYYFKK